MKIEIENLNDKKFSKIFIYSDGLFIKEFNPENKMKVSTKRINKNKILKISNLLREGKGGYKSHSRCGSKRVSCAFVRKSCA